MKEVLKELERRRATARAGGGQARIDAQHAKASSPPASALRFSSTKARSRNSTCCRTSLDRFRHGENQGGRGRRGHRLGHGEWPYCLRFRQGLHRLWRLAIRGACRKGGEGAGNGAAQPRADRWSLRCRGRPHPGGRRGPWRLCRDIPAKRACLGCHPADFGHHGALAPAATSIHPP